MFLILVTCQDVIMCCTTIHALVQKYESPWKFKAPNPWQKSRGAVPSIVFSRGALLIVSLNCHIAWRKKIGLVSLRKTVHIVEKICRLADSSASRKKQICKMSINNCRKSSVQTYVTGLYLVHLRVWTNNLRCLVKLHISCVPMQMMNLL